MDSNKEIPTATPINNEIHNYDTPVSTVTVAPLNVGFSEPGQAPQGVGPTSETVSQPAVMPEKPEVSQPGGFKKLFHKMSMGILFPGAGDVPQQPEAVVAPETPTAEQVPANPPPSPQIPS